MPVENDCEDQGFTRLDDGCTNFQCQTWNPLTEKPVRPLLVQAEYPIGSGRYWWACPKCRGSYGNAPSPYAQKN